MRILVASPIDAAALKELQKEHDTVCAHDPTTDSLKRLIDGSEALIFRSGVSITAELMDCAPGLKLLIRAGSGIDNLDMEYVRRRGLELIRIPEPGAKAVAEMSFALMLALSRNLVEADRLTRMGRWAKHELTGYLLTGKTLGVVGVGNIGSRVAQMGVVWGMQVVGCVEHPSLARAVEMNARGIRLVDFGEVMSKADYISVHVPLKESTRSLIDGDAFARMKPGVFVINLARGGVLDEDALCKVMSNGGGVRGAALDVHKDEGEGRISPLAGLKNVILTPHIGAMTIDSQRQIGSRILEVMRSFTSNGGSCMRNSADGQLVADCAPSLVGPPS
jgi:phosphoglycerate dehydrogenase-like enzyme